MLSRTSLKSSQFFIRKIVSNQLREFHPTSHSSKFSGRSGYGDNKKNGNSLFEFFLRSIPSSVVIIGSSFAFCNYAHNSHSFIVNSRFSFADSPKETTWMPYDTWFQHSSSEKKEKYLFKDTYRRRIFFNYEKRMRMQSPPKKVFEYFASFRSPTGEVYMTPGDLMRAIIPVFPPSESNRVREGFLRGERVPGELHCAPSDFFMLFDTNNDGLISFAEYIFFVTLLSIPESSFSVAFKMFDLNNNGEIDREEFKKVMALMRAQNRQGAGHRNGLRVGLKVGDSVEKGGLLEYFFGKDGNLCLKHGRFVQFLRDLHDEILVLEFAHYDYKQQGTISAKDFALSLVASADISHLNKFLDRIDELNNETHLKNICITFEEFKNFAELRKKLESFSLAIFSYGKVNGLLTKSDFQRAASQVCGISVSDNVVDIIFHMFDGNRDGRLSSKELVRVLEKRENDMLQRREAGIRGLISCWFNCANNCSGGKLHH